MRREYEMTQEQLDKLLEACRPTMYIVANGVGPRSPQENANDAWARLGDEMGFQYMTVEPTSKGDRFFTAESKE
jgi:hypothetical protein